MATEPVSEMTESLAHLWLLIVTTTTTKHRLLQCTSIQLSRLVHVNV